MGIQLDLDHTSRPSCEDEELFESHEISYTFPQGIGLATNRLLITTIAEEMIRLLATFQRRMTREWAEQRRYERQLEKRERHQAEIRKEEDKKQELRLTIQKVEEPKRQEERLHRQKRNTSVTCPC